MRPFALRSASPFALGLAVLSCGSAPAAPATTPSAATAAASPPPAFAAATAAGGEETAVVPISSSDPTWGSRRALVTVVLFGDYQCPYTGKILKTVQALEQKYGPPDLRIVWKDEPLPFHPQARPAAEAAQAVWMLGQNDAYWHFWELALTHQTDLSATSFDAWARAAGVPFAEFQRLAQSHAGGAKVTEGLATAEHLGIRGTPTFVINGVTVQGAQPVEKLIAVIDAALIQAKATLTNGATQDGLYADLARINWKPLPADDDDDDGPKEDDKKVWNVPVAGAPSLGSASAPVTIVEFSDFQCPFCKRVEPTLDEVRKKYGDKVRIVWRDEPLPFHPRALPAAELAREARAEKGDAGFWKAHDAIFASQPALGDDDLAAVAKSLGLDAARVKSAIEGKRYAAAIQADGDLSSDLHADGTPHFFVNGRRLVGAQPIAAFSALIDQELQHADALVAAGTPRAGVYDAIMKGGAKPAFADAVVVAPRAAAPYRGGAAAKVVIEEFADFQCPFCSRADATLHKVEEAYGPKVKVVWRNLPLPFHAHAAEAAEAALEAQHQKGNAGFWAMHDKLYAHQADDGLERPALDAYAKELGLDVAAFDRALDAKAHAAEIAEDSAAATAARISGTPAFVVGGYLISGAQPFDKFRRVIDQVLASGPAKPAAAAATDGGR